MDKLHLDINDFLRSVLHEHGVVIEKISVNWIDISTPEKGKFTINSADVSVTTKFTKKGAT